MRYFFFLLLLVSTTRVNAQSTIPTGDSFVKEEMRSGSEYAEIIRTRSPRLVPTPNQVLAAVQATDPEARLKTMTDLYTYLEDLEVVDCPAGMTVILGRYVFSDRLLHTDYERKCKPGEKLLRNVRTKQLIFSLDCGNTVGSPRYLPGDEPVKIVEKPVEVLVPAPPDTVRIDRVVKEYPKPQILMVNKDRPWGWRVTEDVVSAVVGGIIGYNLHHFSCPATPSGGPVNPPNQLSPGFGISVPIKWP